MQQIRAQHFTSHEKLSFAHRLQLPGNLQPLSLSFGLSYPTGACARYWTSLPKAKALSGLRAALNNRDLYACRFCGFRSHRHQETIARNGVDWDLKEIVTACYFCAQCLMLDRVGKMRSGVLLWLPEMPQADLNLLAPLIYLCRTAHGAPRDKASGILDLLTQRREAARTKVTDNPAVLARKLASCSAAESYLTLIEDVRGIRMLPLDRRIVTESGIEYNMFPQILAYWRSKDGPFGSLSPHELDLTAFDAILQRGFQPVL
jgi:intracellular multiplication protein IcmJ